MTLLILPSVLFSENDVFAQSDILDKTGKYQEDKSILLSAEDKITDPVGKAELYWRLSRVWLNIAETDFLAKRINTNAALKLYEEGERWADKAISSNSRNASAYFWKSANAGMWGQTKGILDSLFKAQPMSDNLRLCLKNDPSFFDAFYVLGELYEKLPGWPISFGNIEYAVSLGRKAADLMDTKLRSGVIKIKSYVVYVSLASHLWIRNWDQARRVSSKPDLLRQYNEKSDYVDRNCFYEGTLNLKNMRDRDEAMEIINMVIRELEAIPNRSTAQEKDLRKARETLAGFR
ncbi:MAG: hypothetical protein EHM28_00185 [Spirochaetaceae bacterium]|nr:MAG: hypothetical protein EHM28_00185 [Spirochaetaceae bacterium]